MVALHEKLRVYAFGVVGFKLPEGTTDTDVADAMIEAASEITRLEQEATDLHEAAAEAQRLYLVADREALDAKRESARLRGEVERLREELRASRDHALTDCSALEERLGQWRIWFDPPPIGTRNCDWHYQHDDAEPECPSWMHGHCASREACIAEIIDGYEERA